MKFWKNTVFLITQFLPSVDTLIGLVIYLKNSDYFTTHRWYFGLAPSCYRDCLLLWKSYSRTVFLVSSLWNFEKSHFFWLLNIAIFWCTYWLSYLSKNFQLFYHPQMVKSLAPSCYRDCLLLWKSCSRTVFLVSSVWKS